MFSRTELLNIVRRRSVCNSRQTTIVVLLFDLLHVRSFYPSLDDFDSFRTRGAFKLQTPHVRYIEKWLIHHPHLTCVNSVGCWARTLLISRTMAWNWVAKLKVKRKMQCLATRNIELNFTVGIRMRCPWCVACRLLPRENSFVTLAIAFANYTSQGL